MAKKAHAVAGAGGNQPFFVTGQPVVISTWDAGLAANKGAWEVLSHNGAALDAVEAGVKITESSVNCCVGLGANPDRDGFVTLDASIMDHQGNCGAVGFLERIKHPISVAWLRRGKDAACDVGGGGRPGVCCRRRLS